MPDPIDLTTYKGTPDYSKELPPPFDPSMIFSPEAPAAPPPMESIAPMMPAAPQPLAPAIPEMPLSPDPKYATFEEYMNRPEEDYILEKYQGPVAPTLPTVGPPGTTITPPAPQDQIDTQPLTRQLGPNVPEGFIPPSGPSTSALVKYWNPTTGETWTASSGGWTAPEGWERAPLPTFNFNQPPPASSPQPLPMQPLPIGQQPLLPSMPGKEQRPPPFIGRGPAAPLSPIPPVNVVQENIEREIIPPQLPVAPIQQATPNILGVQDREPGFTQADYMRPQMTGTPATAFPSLLPHQQPYQQFAPTNLMGEPQKKALRDLLSRGRFGPGGF